MACDMAKQNVCKCKLQKVTLKYVITFYQQENCKFKTVSPWITIARNIIIYIISTSFT